MHQQSVGGSFKSRESSCQQRLSSKARPLHYDLRCLSDPQILSKPSLRAKRVSPLGHQVVQASLATVPKKAKVFAKNDKATTLTKVYRCSSGSSMVQRPKIPTQKADLAENEPIETRKTMLYEQSLRGAPVQESQTKFKSAFAGAKEYMSFAGGSSCEVRKMQQSSSQQSAFQTVSSFKAQAASRKPCEPGPSIIFQPGLKHCRRQSIGMGVRRNMQPFVSAAAQGRVSTVFKPAQELVQATQLQKSLKQTSGVKNNSVAATQSKPDSSSAHILFGSQICADQLLEPAQAEARKNPTVGGHVAVGTSFESDFKRDSSDISPLPLSVAITKQSSSEAYPLSSNEQSQRHAALSFGKSSNAPSESRGGFSGGNLNFSRATSDPFANHQFQKRAASPPFCQTDTFTYAADLVLSDSENTNPQFAAVQGLQVRSCNAVFTQQSATTNKTSKIQNSVKNAKKRSQDSFGSSSGVSKRKILGIKSPSGPLSRKADLPHQLLTRATGKINRPPSPIILYPDETDQNLTKERNKDQPQRK